MCKSENGQKKRTVKITRLLARSMTALAENPNDLAQTSVNELRPIELPQERDNAKDRDPTRYGDWELNGRCIDF